MTRRSIRVLTFVGRLLAAVGLLLQLGVAARPALAQDPPPRPTLVPTQTPTPAPVPTDNSAPSPTDVPTGRIIGTVIDLTTNAPASGIQVAVGDVTVTTDASGNYERAGLSAGSYQIALVLTAAQGVPEQGPITVALAAGATVVQHLAFRSPVAATAVPATPTVVPPTPTPAGPVTLPDTGDNAGSAAVSQSGLLAALILLLGIAIWGLTEWSRRKSVKRRPF